MSSFEDFLRTGAFGEVKVGLASFRVGEILGVPDFRWFSSKPVMWHYKTSPGLELTFTRTPDDPTYSLARIKFQFTDLPERTRDLPTLKGWRPMASTTIQQFAAYLGEVRPPLIHETIRRQLGDIDENKRVNFTLVLDSGVKLAFESSRLASLQFTAPQEPRTKQVSITVGRTEWEVVRRKADHLKLTVGAYCSRLITEHARNPLVPPPADRSTNS